MAHLSNRTNFSSSLVHRCSHDGLGWIKVRVGLDLSWLIHVDFWLRQRKTILLTKKKILREHIYIIFDEGNLIVAMNQRFSKLQKVARQGQLLLIMSRRNLHVRIFDYNCHHLIIIYILEKSCKNRNFISLNMSVYIDINEYS